MKTFTILDHGGQPHTCAFWVDRYRFGEVAVSVAEFDDGADPDLEPNLWTDLSCGGAPDLFLRDGRDFVAKTYSENAGLLEQLEALGLVERTGEMIGVGHAGPQPVCRLTAKAAGYVAFGTMPEADDEE